MITLWILALTQSAVAATPAQSAPQQQQQQQQSQRRPAEATPAPAKKSPTAAPPNQFKPGEMLVTQPADRSGKPNAIVVEEKAPVTRFELSHEGGKLLLSFRSTDPKIQLRSDLPMVIQINSDEPLEVEPSLITNEDWPKNATQMTLSYKWAEGGSPQIDGEQEVEAQASYSACRPTDAQCEKRRSRHILTFKP